MQVPWELIRSVWVYVYRKVWAETAVLLLLLLFIVDGFGGAFKCERVDIGKQNAMATANRIICQQN